MSNRTEPEAGAFIDQEEREIAESLERDEWTPVADPTESIREARRIAGETLKKNRRMNIRISERDLKHLKARAAEEGVPYQTLVSSVLHKYVSGRLTESAGAK